MGDPKEPAEPAEDTDNPKHATGDKQAEQNREDDPPV